MSRERSIELDALTAADPVGTTSKTHYNVIGECSNCGYRGAAGIPRGMPCPVNAICPANCPNCGCENLTRTADDSYPPGLEAFVDKGIEDKMINPANREVALRRMSTIEGCCAMVRLVYLQGVSREREADLQRQRVQAELEVVRNELQIWRGAGIHGSSPNIAAVPPGYTPDRGVVADDMSDRVSSSLSSVSSQQSSISGDAIGVSGGMVPRSQWLAGFAARRRAFGVSSAEVERAYRDRDINGSGITIVGGSVSGNGIRAGEAAVVGNNVAGPLLTELANQQAAMMANEHARTWGLDIRQALANDPIKDNDEGAK